MREFKELILILAEGESRTKVSKIRDLYGDKEGIE